GSATPDRVDKISWNVGNAGTGITWPPALPFSLALERARALDRSALGMLYDRFMPVVYRFVLARVSSIPIAEDITSETFLAVVQGISAMRAHDELTFAAWVLGIARNKVFTHFRRQHVRPEAPQALSDDEQPIAVAEEGDPLTIIAA